MSWWRKLFGSKKPPITWEESDWILFATVPIASGKLWVGDAQFAPIEEDGEIVEVPPGDYECFVKKLRLSNEDVRISRLRARKAETQPTLGQQIGTTWADTASQGICDFVAYSEAVPDDSLVMEDSEEYGFVERIPGGKLAYCRSGWGDGEFKLFELTSEGARCGVEVEMIDLEDPLPDWLT